MFHVGYIISADFGEFGNFNFGNPQDLLRFMQEENLDSVVVTGCYFSVVLSALSLSFSDVQKWAEGNI